MTTAKTAKIAISLDSKLLQKLDALVERHFFKNRSQAFQIALQERIERLEHARLARECAKLDPAAEQRLAEEGLSKDVSEWSDF